MTITTHGVSHDYTEAELIQLVEIADAFRRIGVDPDVIAADFIRYHLSRELTADQIVAVACNTQYPVEAA